MQLYRALIRLESPLSTPLQGDTIWGHLCWSIVLREGEEALLRFFSRYSDGTVPVIYSDVFPHDMLPNPELKPVFRETEEKFEDIALIKAIKRRKYLPKSFFGTDTAFSVEKIRKVLEFADTEPDEMVKRVTRKHNTINRISGTTGDDGSFFTSEELWISAKDQIFDLYVLGEMGEKELLEYTKMAFEHGYGADRSTGKGFVSVLSMEPVETKKEGNRKMALSSFIPSDYEQFKNPRTRNFTKYGKLGEWYSIGRNPFKKPVVLFQQGSTWDRTDDSLFFGTFLQSVHNDPSIKQMAMTPVIFFDEE